MFTIISLIHASTKEILFCNENALAGLADRFITSITIVSPFREEFHGFASLLIIIYTDCNIAAPVRRMMRFI